MLKNKKNGAPVQRAPTPKWTTEMEEPWGRTKAIGKSSISLSLFSSSLFSAVRRDVLCCFWEEREGWPLKRDWTVLEINWQFRDCPPSWPGLAASLLLVMDGRPRGKHILCKFLHSQNLGFGSRSRSLGMSKFPSTKPWLEVGPGGRER
ncbi:hypothetical protein E2320_013898 [Naja naja]|nr:hypothetical protein E2320_013898 [Naja naja]